MDVKNLVAIDVHTHADVSSRIPDCGFKISLAEN